jgi:integrase
MSRSSTSFRVGRVQAYLRGSVWYLCYHEQGRRHRPRVGPDRQAARQLAAQINAQIQNGAPAALSFTPVSVPELRQRWLAHHEQVLCSSVHTLDRYRTATDYLLRFERDIRPVRSAAQFQVAHAEEFVRYLRTLRVAPNGHPHARLRPLRDTGVRYILETCRALFSYAHKRRHLSPYAENPFAMLELGRIPIEDARPLLLFDAEQERLFLQGCDNWQFPLFLTLLLTGLRPGELTHLLLPQDLDLEAGLLRIRNKPQLGWQVKTRNERDIPLVPVLIAVPRGVVGHRITGPVFRRRRFTAGPEPLLSGLPLSALQEEFREWMERREAQAARPFGRAERLRQAKQVWRDAGAIKEDRIRLEFMAVTRKIGLPEATAPKLLRHLFATALQDANVDPLIRNELMGHTAWAGRRAGSGLGMTAVYTHTRPETRREQLQAALQRRPALGVALNWLKRAGS